MRGCSRGGMHGFIRGGMHGFIWGACMVLFGGHALFYLGGRAWFYLGGMRGFFSFFRYNEIRSMSGRYASYWNAFLLKLLLATFYRFTIISMHRSVVESVKIKTLCKLLQ